MGSKQRRRGPTPPKLQPEAPAKQVSFWHSNLFLGLATLVAAVIAGLLALYGSGKLSFQEPTNSSEKRPGVVSPKPRSTIRAVVDANPASCKDPPTTATLNYWPVTYLNSAEACHDYPPVDARLLNGEYSQSQEDWENGLDAHEGDLIYVLMWINNGAADNAERINPGRGIARNVKISTAVEIAPGSIHRVNVEFSSDNTPTLAATFIISTADNQRLEVVRNGGQLYDRTGEKLLKDNLEVGNSTTLIGDMRPLFQEGRYLRFSMKVVGGS